MKKTLPRSLGFKKVAKTAGLSSLRGVSSGSDSGSGAVVLLTLLVLGVGAFVLSKDPGAVLSSIQSVPAPEQISAMPAERENYFLESSETPGYVTFHDTQYGFRIDYPETWNLKTPDFDLVAAMFFAPSSEESTFVVNVNVTVDDAARYGDLSLQDYADQALAQLEGILSEYALLDQGTRSFGEFEGRFVRASYRDGETPLELYSVFTVAGGRVYALTYSTLPGQDTPIESVTDHMVGSFALESAPE